MNMRPGIEFKSPGYGVRQALEDWHKQFPYKYELVGQTPRAVILGEDHDQKEIIDSQANLISAIQPPIVLYEPLHAWQYNPTTKTLELIPGRKTLKGQDFIFKNTDSTSTPRPIINAPPQKLIEAAGENTRIIGCDLTYAEFKDVEIEIANKDPKNYRYEGRLIKKRRPEEIVNYYSPEINPFRDRLMANVILKNQQISTAPLIVILGWKHVARIKKSAVLENAGLEYAVIRQDKPIKQAKL